MKWRTDAPGSDGDVDEMIFAGEEYSVSQR